MDNASASGGFFAFSLLRGADPTLFNSFLMFLLLLDCSVKDQAKQVDRVKRWKNGFRDFRIGC